MAYTFVFDLDGTITTEESLPVLARCLGIGEEMQARTAAAMQGNGTFAPDFASDFAQRVAMLAPLPIAQAQQVVAQLGLFTKVADFIVAHKKSCQIVTGNLDVYIEALLARLEMQGRCTCSTAMVVEDKVVGVSQVCDKAATVQALPRPIVCIGDGSNDVGMLAQADIAIAFGGAHPVAPTLQAVADYYFTSETELCTFLRQLAAEE